MYCDGVVAVVPASAIFSVVYIDVTAVVVVVVCSSNCFIILNSSFFFVIFCSLLQTFVGKSFVFHLQLKIEVIM